MLSISKAGDLNKLVQEGQLYEPSRSARVLCFDHLVGCMCGYSYTYPKKLKQEHLIDGKDSEQLTS